MCPDDPTPLGDAMTHRFPEQKIPEREPDGHPHNGRKPGAVRHVDVSERPALPEHGGQSTGEARDDAAGRPAPDGSALTGSADGASPGRQRG